MAIQLKNKRVIGIPIEKVDSVSFINDKDIDTALYDWIDLKDTIQFNYDSFSNDGFLETNGSISHIGEGWKYTDYIDITQVSRIEVLACMNNCFGGGVQFYDETRTLITSTYNISNTNVANDYNTYYSFNESEIPLKARSIRVQCGKSATNSYAILNISKYNPKDTVYIHDTIIIDNSTLFPTNKTKDSENLPLSMEIPDIRNNYSILFDSKIDNTFESVSIIRGRQQYSCATIEITQDSIIIYKGNRQAEQYCHNLSMKDYISFFIDKHYKDANITLITNGGIFKTKSDSWSPSRDGIYIEETSNSNKECRISFDGYDLNKRIWIFGDSYLDYWSNYIIDAGYTSVMFDGYSGRNSISALYSLKQSLEFGKPNLLFWAMGMNDRDSSGIINEEWKTVIDELIDLCKQNNIELVLSTIPVTSSRNNYEKNNYVRMSGLRYVDINKAVGADISESWYDGLLNTDDTHPTEEGAKVIAERVLLEIPEISR